MFWGGGEVSYLFSRPLNTKLLYYDVTVINVFLFLAATAIPLKCACQNTRKCSFSDTINMVKLIIFEIQDGILACYHLKLEHLCVSYYILAHLNA